MDAKALHQILRAEKAHLKTSLPHVVKPYQGVLKVAGTAFLGTDDLLQVSVIRGKIELLYHREKLPAITDDEGRLMIRHELCHVLDRVDGKIGHEFFGFKPEGSGLLEGELMNGITAETVRAYYEFSMARRYIALFGLDEFRMQNEIGMEEFLTFTHNLILEVRHYPTEKLAAYALYGIVYSVFKEATKVRFYQPRDQRFPAGLWQIVEWLGEDFEYLDQQAMPWKQKSNLLAFIALTLFENVDLDSALSPVLTKLKAQFTLKVHGDLHTTLSFAQELADQWQKRIDSLLWGQS